MDRKDVYEVIDSERKYQDDKWGGSAHDASKSVAHFLVYMRHYLTRAEAAMTSEVGDEAALHELRKVAALGVACFEQHGCPVRTIRPVLVPWNRSES